MEDEFWEGLQSLGLGRDLSRSHVSRIVKSFKASGGTTIPSPGKVLTRVLCAKMTFRPAVEGVEVHRVCLYFQMLSSRQSSNLQQYVIGFASVNTSRLETKWSTENASVRKAVAQRNTSGRGGVEGRCACCFRRNHVIQADLSELGPLPPRPPPLTTAGSETRACSLQRLREGDDGHLFGSWPRQRRGRQQPWGAEREEGRQSRTPPAVQRRPH